MKRGLLVAGIVLCGLLAAAKLWGLVFIAFSVKQTIYAVAFALTAAGMAVTLRNQYGKKNGQQPPTAA